MSPVASLARRRRGWYTRDDAINRRGKRTASPAAGATPPTTGWRGSGSATEQETNDEHKSQKTRTRFQRISRFHLLGCQKPSKQEPRQPLAFLPKSRGKSEKTKQVAAESLGLKLEGSVEAGHKDNFSGFYGNITFTQRLDSRTYIAYDTVSPTRQKRDPTRKPTHTPEA